MAKAKLFNWMIGAALAAGLVGAASTGAMAQDVLAKVKAAGTLKVGTETAFAPFDFIKDGAHVGFNVDLFAEIGKEMGVKIAWTELPWEGVLPGLETGKFDIVAGPATITKARVERYRFTTPIAEATVALMKKTGDTSIKEPADVAGKTVGAGKATAQLAQLQTWGATLAKPVATKEYPGYNEAYAELATGRIAAVANSLPNLAYVSQQRAGVFELVQPPFGQKSYFGFPGRKDADYKTLMDAVDVAILKIKGDGRMAKLQEKWFGVAFATPDVAPPPNF